MNRLHPVCFHPLEQHAALALRLALFTTLALPASAMQSTTLQSRNAAGTSIQGICGARGMTADGRYVVLFTAATDLDPSIPPLAPMPDQLWIRDRTTGQNELISVSTSGGYSAAYPIFSGGPDVAVSADGRFVAFDTVATDLVPGDTNARGDVFVRDRQSGLTTRASVSAAGAQLTEHSQGSSVSNDGRYVLFVTRANGVVPGVDGGIPHLYRRDLVVQTTELVARDVTSSHEGIHADLSADGNLVAYSAFSPSLDVYVRDFTSGLVTLESVTPGGQAAGGYAPQLSADGTVVGFISQSGSLVAGDTNGRDDIFVRNRVAGITRIASKHSNGQLIAAGTSSLTSLLLSADGMHVAFYADASNLIDADMNVERHDVFVHDVLTAQTEIVSVDSNGGQSPHSDTHATIARGISADGQLVLFDSIHEFTPDDTGGRSVFLHDRTLPTPRTFCFGTASACPCANAGAVGFGCLSQNTTVGVRLFAAGSASVSSDGFLLQAIVLPAGAPVLFFQGTARANGGLGRPFGDGLRCAAGTTTRLGVKFVEPSGYVGFGSPLGDTPISVRGNVPAAGGTYHYQVWFRDVSSWCTPSAFNTSNGLTMTWLP